MERIKLAQYYQEFFSWQSKEDIMEIIEEEQVNHAQIKPEDIKTTNEVLGKATSKIH